LLTIPLVFFHPRDILLERRDLSSSKIRGLVTKKSGNLISSVGIFSLQDDAFTYEIFMLGIELLKFFRLPLNNYFRNLFKNTLVTFALSFKNLITRSVRVSLILLISGVFCRSSRDKLSGMSSESTTPRIKRIQLGKIMSVLLLIRTLRQYSEISDLFSSGLDRLKLGRSIGI